MTDLEIAILQAIHNQIYREAHRKILYDLNKSNPEIIKSTLDDLLKLELIEKIPLSNCYKLSGPGLKALHLVQKERENESKQESQQRFEQECEERRIKKQYKHDWKMAIVSAIIGTISGFFASLLFWLITK